jgi:DNA polymerase-3 subunit alpha
VAPPQTLRERLMLEKAAIGFFLSGHLFDEVAEEVRRFARLRVADAADSREPQLLAGIVAGVRFVNGQRGRAAIFKLDDGSGAIEAVANEALIDDKRELLVDDMLVVVQGKVQLDRFSGGLRLTVQQLWDLASARARFGRFLRVAVQAGGDPAAGTVKAATASGLPDSALQPVRLAEVIGAWPARRLDSEHGELMQGLAVRLKLQHRSAEAELDLGDAGRFWPSDEALAQWRELAHAGQADVVYDAA